MLAVLRREMSNYFTSPIGYIFLAVFYFFSGMFFTSVLAYNSTDITNVFSSLFTVLIFIIPLTSPVKLGGLVFGKFLAAFFMYCIALAITVIYSIVLAAFEAPEWSIVIGNIFGALLLGAALIAVGVFISSLTENQLIAAIGSFAVMMFIMLIDNFASLIPERLSFLSTFLTSISFMTRYSDFVSGILNFANVLFFLSVAVIFNFLTVRVLEKKRWS